LQRKQPDTIHNMRVAIWKWPDKRHQPMQRFAKQLRLILKQRALCVHQQVLTNMQTGHELLNSCRHVRKRRPRQTRTQSFAVI
jgi:hypothetical protein